MEKDGVVLMDPRKTYDFSVCQHATNIETDLLPSGVGEKYSSVCSISLVDLKKIN